MAVARRTRAILLVTALLVVAVAGAAVYYFFFAGDAPPPAALSEPVGDDTAAGDGAEGPTSLDGTWVVLTRAETDEADSFAGYRVTETVLGVGRPREAVGRTRQVDGMVAIDGTTITAAEVTADLSTLLSDDGRRDDVLRGRGLETREFPTTSFRLTEPIELGTIPAPGERRSVTAVGELTLHGATRTVSIPLEAAIIGGSEPRIEIAGGVEIDMADFAIEPPNVAGVVTVEDRGTVEVHLYLAPA
ncbi:MAG: YceI family protein [Acidimicrobiales bacterium]